MFQQLLSWIVSLISENSISCNGAMLFFVICSGQVSWFVLINLRFILFYFFKNFCRDKAYFVDLFVRASNMPAIKMYEKVCSVYQNFTRSTIPTCSHFLLSLGWWAGRPGIRVHWVHIWWPIFGQVKKLWTHYWGSLGCVLELDH